MSKCFCSKCNIDVNRLSNYQCPNCMTLIFRDDMEYQKYNNRMALKKKSTVQKKSTVDQNLSTSNIINKEIEEETEKEEAFSRRESILENNEGEHITDDNLLKPATDDIILAENHNVSESNTISDTNKNTTLDFNVSLSPLNNAPPSETIIKNNTNETVYKKNRKKKKKEEKKIVIEGFNPNHDGYYNDTPFVFPEIKDNFFKETMKKTLIGIIFFIIILIIYVWYWIS